MHGTVGTVLAYLNCCVYQWFSYLLQLHLVTICLFACSWWLVVSGYYYYLCLSNNQQWLCAKVVKAGCLSLGMSTSRTGNISCISGVRMPYCHSVHGSTYHYIPNIAGLSVTTTDMHCSSCIKQLLLHWHIVLISYKHCCKSFYSIYYINHSYHGVFKNTMLEIATGHRPFSDQLQHMADQNLFCSVKRTVRFQLVDN